MDFNSVIFFGSYIPYTMPNWLVLIINVIMFFLIIKVLYWLIENVLRVFTRKTKTDMDDHILSALENPLLISLSVGFVLLATKSLFTVGIYNWIYNIGIVIVIVLITKFLYSLIGIIYIHVLMPLADKTDSKMDDQLYPLLRKTLRVLLVIFSVIYILSFLKVNITPILTGVGLGGLALAFAAQKILGDIFGGVSIFTSKPFQLGDFVKISGGSGTVTDIGLRYTRLKTLDGTSLVIPNSQISSELLDNVSKRKSRKESMVLGLTYDTSNAKIEKAKKIVEEIFKKEKKVDETYYIAFNEFNSSSLDLQVIYWVNELNYGEYLKIKDKINSTIKERFEKEKIEFAFPTQTVFLNKA
jgi:MscS family membrane protein